MTDAGQRIEAAGSGSVTARHTAFVMMKTNMTVARGRGLRMQSTILSMHRMWACFACKDPMHARMHAHWVWTPCMQVGPHACAWGCAQHACRLASRQAVLRRAWPPGTLTQLRLPTACSATLLMAAAPMPTNHG
eukprot:354578-Chlamydomonas_euryale.AAC.3